MTPNFTPRPSQEQILRYRGGRLGIAAVPGAGKTHILSALAAQIIHRGALQDGQEVLIVTLVNSAVDNFETRIKSFFDTKSQIQTLYKYRVRTLHGLAHDIVREKPSRVGLEERFSIIDEREAEFIRGEAVNAWLASHPNYLDEYFDPALDESKRDWARRKQLPDMIDSLALAFIRSAKDRLLTPEALRAKLDSSPAPLPLAELGYSIYVDYQRALAYRGAVDFDDLIRYALILLQSDEEFLERLRYRYPFILEDEAQDSSMTQEKILSLLSGGRAERSDSVVEALSASGLASPSGRGTGSEGGNWVRVGDPNQAIFETFTTASPELLRAFIKSNPHADMPESGRSQPTIIALANHLIDWVMNAHPAHEARAALSVPHIQPVPSGYEPQNPPEDPEAIRLISKKYTPEEETENIVKSVKSYLDSLADVPDEEQPTIAILVPRNQRGIEVVEALKKRGIQPIELIASTSNTRAAAGSLNYLLAYLADPQSARKLSRAYEVWRRDWREGMSLRATEEGEAIPPTKDEMATSQKTLLATTATLLRKIGNVEAYVNPHPALSRGERGYESPSPTGEALGVRDESAEVIQELSAFRIILKRWLEAVTLPIDQLILTLAQDVFADAADLALAHKLALVLRKAANDHADWRLPELTAELAVIAKNERRFIGFSSDDSGFDPEKHRGRVVVTTMHKAKGLEWDRVYLMSVNNYDFPSLQPNDRFISEKWFVRGSNQAGLDPREAGTRSTRPAAYSTNPLNLEAEALAQLAALESTGEYDWYEEGSATQRARVDYVRERLRLLYVGLTRAKRALSVTWNSGRQGDATPSLALSELLGWMAEE